MRRVAVFIDWQNAYQQARVAFGLAGSGSEGQFSPLRLAQLLAERNRRGEDGRLVHVEIHRGQPLPSVDRVGHAAVALQVQAWMAEAPDVVQAQLRPLARQSDGRYLEKGVDVHLAACAIEWSVVRRTDTVIIVSHDSDLRPVVEVLSRIKSPAAVETASWRSSTYFKRIAPYRSVVNHTLSRSVLESVADPMRYGAMARRRLQQRERRAGRR